MEEEMQPTCWAGLQVIGTLLGTMFGFVSSAVLSKFLGGGVLSAVPGVVIGSSMGVLATYFAGESGLPQREILYKSARSFGAALALTVIYAGLLGPVMPEGGAVTIVTLATVASLGSSAVLICSNYKGLLGGTVAAGDGASLPLVDIKAKDSHCPKEV